MRRMRCGRSRVGVWQGLILAFIWLVLIVLMLIPLSSRPHRDADARQKAQFSALNAAIELFNNEFDGYPPSDANDVTGVPYCGAMKLTEAVMGQDLLGFHSLSVYRADGMDANGRASLYCRDSREPDPNKLRLRRGPYLPAESRCVFTLAEVYGKGNTGPFPKDTFVLCDTYERRRPGGKKTGMPILYYRANLSGTTHDADNPDSPANIFNYMDNYYALICLGVPGKPKQVHPLADPAHFYLHTRDPESNEKPEPYRRDTFILISAGEDGLYGTKDDIHNFAR